MRNNEDGRYSTRSSPHSPRNDVPNLENKSGRYQFTKTYVPSMYSTSSKGFRNPIYSGNDEMLTRDAKIEQKTPRFLLSPRVNEFKIPNWDHAIKVHQSFENSLKSGSSNTSSSSDNHSGNSCNSNKYGNIAQEPSVPKYSPTRNSNTKTTNFNHTGICSKSFSINTDTRSPRFSWNESLVTRNNNFTPNIRPDKMDSDLGDKSSAFTNSSIRAKMKDLDLL